MIQTGKRSKPAQFLEHWFFKALVFLEHWLLGALILER
jgi:hypothetical protein